MRATKVMVLAVTACLFFCSIVAYRAFGNGGPFLVKYPGGDPAAKGVLARLDPSLKPAEENRLKVLKEDLSFLFTRQSINDVEPPLVKVTAAYAIENPTDKDVEIDFGFSILRGIYLLNSMSGPYADATIKVENKPNDDKKQTGSDKTSSNDINVPDKIVTTVISNSHIYGIIRRNARDVIDKSIASDVELSRRILAIRDAIPKMQLPENSENKGNQNAPAVDDKVISPKMRQARDELQLYLTSKMKWNARDALLLVEFASLPFFNQDTAAGKTSRSLGYVDPLDRWAAYYFNNTFLPFNDTFMPGQPNYSEEALKERQAFNELKNSNLGPLAAIGEQKATQLLAQLASRFDPKAASVYESIFSAWGGDVRERSLDLVTGQLRPREVALPLSTIAKDVENKNRKYEIQSGNNLASLKEGKPNIVLFGGESKEDDKAPEIKDYRLTADPTVFARIDYLDPNVPLSAEEKASCQSILNNLPVVFTFAPMNLLYFQVKFPARQTRSITISYSQYAFADTREPATYQMAYVLHPATLWKDFGPINLTINSPSGILCKATAPIEKMEKPKDSKKTATTAGDSDYTPVDRDTFKATLTERKDKSGELFIAIDKAAWDKMFSAKNKNY
jgi:hypothetical protein